MKKRKVCQICSQLNLYKTGKCCSKECSSILRKRNCLVKYGVSHPLQTKEIKEKIKQTMMDKYSGFTFQSSLLIEKMKATNLERYGVENPGQSVEVQNKMKATNLERYGVPFPRCSLPSTTYS